MIKTSLFLVIALAGCKDSSTSKPATEPAAKPVETATTAPAEQPAAPTEQPAAPTEQPAAAPRCRSRDACIEAAGAARYGSPEQRAALVGACDFGSMQACHDAGNQLADYVNNSAEDVAKGVALLERACTGGAARGWSCEQASLAYATGEKIGKDPAKAKALHARACKQGLVQGCPCKTTAQCGENEGLVCEQGTCVTAEVQ